ncbi:PREDICTED: band 4.1-like protein 4A [Galeopterus variegatus]|uniref:Band 4.1-like protein 4A n=1 Tax=Galeopterus variegatus TaxID=482537 RepID=A0ABM0QDF6_GALVR|nr:PREDICTED: band 4.1-like protein 4A [Galeopterus variegatus]
MGCFCAVPEEFYCEVLLLDESKLTLTTQQQGIKESKFDVSKATRRTDSQLPSTILLRRPKVFPAPVSSKSVWAPRSSRRGTEWHVPAAPCSTPVLKA